jgi:hypothetical protein
MTKITLPSDAAEQIVERLEARLGFYLGRSNKAMLQADIEDAMQKWGEYISRVVAEGLQ